MASRPGVERELTRLRTGLLAGRGPGASEAEILRHTRDRPALGAVPPPVERAITAGQARQARAGVPAAAPGRALAQPRARWRVAAGSAVATLLLRSVIHRLLSSRRWTRRSANRQKGTS
jgi:hypothetical protein